MVFKVILLVLTLTFVVCQEQTSFPFFPFFSNNQSGNTEKNTSENAFTKVLSAITHFPITLARMFGPKSENVQTNNEENSDKIIAQFEAGLDNEDVNLTIEELIVKYGFKVEKHLVKTKDGYILSMFRIPNNGSVVFLMHGLLSSGDDFVVAGPETGLAYLLAREGYDVWIGNARGNKHSRLHIELNLDSAEFWDFSYHEIGVYDLPAMIDHALKTTEKQSLIYIGHSQGTTSFFVMASEKPEYNSKISLMIALSPVAFVTNTKAPLIKLIASGEKFIYSITKGVGVYEFLPDNDFVRTLKSMFCSNAPFSKIICSNIVFLSFGLELAQVNVTNLPVIIGHTPAGGSLKQLAHFAQGVRSNDFRKFDYGKEDNIRLYGTIEPPRYALDNITVPIGLFYSEDDWVARSLDVERLFFKLNSVIDLYRVPYKPFSHWDFLVAKDFKTLIYKRIKKVMKKL